MNAKQTVLLVFRDKVLANVRYETFDNLDDARVRQDEAEKTWDGEIVRCFGKSLETIITNFPEYRLPEEAVKECQK